MKMKHWFSRLMEMRRSLLSWMRWRRRMRQRMQVELLAGVEEIASRHRLELERVLTSQLQERNATLVELLGTLSSQATLNARDSRELVMDLMNSLQPPPEVTLKNMVGLPQGRPTRRGPSTRLPTLPPR